MATRRKAAPPKRKGPNRPRTGSSVDRSELLRSMEDEDGNKISDEDAEILQEAYERFGYCTGWEQNFRGLFVQDVKFANGDPDNGWQWPDDMRELRTAARKPTLTINKTQNHINLVVNDSRQNKAAIVVKPAGEMSSFQAAQGLESLVRNIEYQSTATAIYDDMSQNQVEGGIGYGRIISIYPDPRSFDQELRIAPVDNHLNVYLDPDIKQKNGSDARYGFIFSDVARDLYEVEYDDDNPPIDTAPLGMTLGADWITADHVRVAEYYRIKIVKDELIYYRHGENEATFLRSEVPRDMRAKLRRDEQAFKDGSAGPDVEIITRPTETKTLEWYKIGANKILDRRKYPTQYVPIFRFVGRERVIEGKLERKGLTRTLKDAQRMYNYNSSAEAEAAAVASKTNWIAALESIAGNEIAWNNANTQTKAVLTYRHKDRDGEPIPKPERVDPAKSAEAYLAGMEIASRELEMASGQGAAQFGKSTQERTGKALTENRRQGDLLTYDFIDNQSLGIQYAGMIILDWIPHCYKTKQVVQIMDKDGTERQLTIDPTAKQPYQEEQDDDKIEAILNPKIGRYKVQAQAGPAYATQRQEAWNAFVQIVTGAPDLINEIGDLMFLSADFPMADKIAERIRRKIKQMAPWLLEDDAVNPQVQALQQQLQQAGQQLAELLQQLAEKDKRLKEKSEDLSIRAADVSNKYRDTDIKKYDAISKRITAATNAQLDLDRSGQRPELIALIQAVLTDVLGTQGETDFDKREPVPQIADLSGNDPDDQGDDGADFDDPRQAPDGHHYVRRGGQHFRVDVGALNGGGGGQPA